MSMRPNSVQRLACSALTSFTALLLWLTVGLAQAQVANDVTLTLDHPDGLYKAGETATFQITLSDSIPVDSETEVTYVVDDFLKPLDVPQLPVKPGVPVDVPVTVNAPGSVRMVVTIQRMGQKPNRFLLGAAFSPTEIQPSRDVPEDFDQYWQQQKAKLSQIPLEPVLEPVSSSQGISAFDLKVNCIDEVPVSGYFAKPEKADRGAHPAILWVHGAGVRSSNLENATRGARWGMLSLDINAHGLANGQSDDFYRQQNSGPLRDYRTRGRQDRDSIYFRGMFLRVVRALDFLTSQPEWDGKHLIVIGSSQGGGQALAAGGLDPRVTAIAVGVPALCDHSGASVGRINGWPKLVPLDRNGRPDPQALKAAAYFDGVNFAKRCKAQAIMSVGLVDATCPPTSCYAAFNQLQGPKTIIVKPEMGHAHPPDVAQQFYNFVRQHTSQDGKAPDQLNESPPSF